MLIYSFLETALCLFPQFSKASAADFFVMEISQIIRMIAENAAQLTFSEDDVITIQKNLEIIVLIDIKALAKLLGQNESAEGVDPSENTGTVHDVFPPERSIIPLHRAFPSCDIHSEHRRCLQDAREEDSFS